MIYVCLYVILLFCLFFYNKFTSFLLKGSLFHTLFLPNTLIPIYPPMRIRRGRKKTKTLLCLLLRKPLSYYMYIAKMTYGGFIIY